VPVSGAALERAIELNAVAVDFNKQAFLYGRRYAHRPEQVLALLPRREAVEQPTTLDALIDDRAARLVEYQDEAYAGAIAARSNGCATWTRARRRRIRRPQVAAKALYKLMAYKDEYEVARLYSHPDFLASIEARFEGDYELRFNLAPPLFSKRDPHTGHLLKREYGPWMLRAFALLAPLKRLRGTALDVFGYTAERRRERQDISAYEQLVDTLRPRFADADYATLRELLALPLQLRGFGHVKDANRAQLDARRRQLLARLEGGADPVQIVEAA
jgi:indolepyruvate ferredoxin oxidoreductase